LRDDAAGDTAAGDEAERAGEVVGHDRLELVGRVAVGDGDDDLLALAHRRAATLGELDALVLADLADLGEHEVAVARREVAAHERGGAEVDAAGRVGALDADELAWREAPDGRGGCAA